jgi:hypothetical protein
MQEREPDLMRRLAGILENPKPRFAEGGFVPPRRDFPDA